MTVQRKICPVCRHLISVKPYNRHIQKHVLLGEVALEEAPWHRTRQQRRRRSTAAGIDWEADTRALLEAGRSRAFRSRAERHSTNGHGTPTSELFPAVAAQQDTAPPVTIDLTEGDLDCVVDLLFPDGIPTTKAARFAEWYQATKRMMEEH